MTGPTHQYTRQHSSTTVNSNPEKTHEPKLRRCSSADDHNSLELVPDDNDHKEYLYVKRERTMTDDSGTEEIEQQWEHMVISTLNADENNLIRKTPGVNGDEGYSECENPEKSQVFDIQNDRKLSNLFFCFVIMTRQKKTL
jgi:hypothetical protein